MPGEGLNIIGADPQAERIRAALHGGLKVGVGLGTFAQNIALDFLQQIVVADVVRHNFLLIDADKVLHFEFVNNRIGGYFTLFFGFICKQITQNMFAQVLPQIMQAAGSESVGTAQRGQGCLEIRYQRLLWFGFGFRLRTVFQTMPAAVRP